ncbi:MAG: SAM-dependent methyltransferase [Clostridiales bacterium]|nr:SAM-dependent methyltransferase [Clostridiales bacterium]
MNIKLNSRLKKIADLIPEGSIVADIGTDHGLIPIYLIENKISPKVIAGDIHKRPLKIAKENIEYYKLIDKIELRLGNGLEILKPGEVDTVIIAGVGGRLITKILDKDKNITNSIENFILQPMRGQREVRKYLLNNNFTIQKDVLVKENQRIYEIIVAKRGKQEITDKIYYEIGLFLKSNPRDVAIEFITEKINIKKTIIKNIKNQSEKNALKKYKKSITKLEKLQEVLKWLQE